MNDTPCTNCFWWECCACDGAPELCNHCISFGDKTYQLLYQAYQADVDEALTPVHNKWADIFKKTKN